ncbi:surfactant protein Ba [Synchiropus picturatus]
MLSNAEFQKKLINGVEDLCVYLPGPDSAQKVCKEELEKILPVAIHIIAAIVRPEDVCKVIGICGPGDRQKVLDNFVSAEVSMTNEKVSATPLCSFCIFLIKTIERLLPKERTEAAVIKVLDEICFILPASLRDQCEDVIGKFGKPVMDALLSYATPQYICTLIHLCKGEEAAHVEPCSLDTYRCRDVPTALKCGTLFYCQRFSWKPLQYGTL